MPLRRITSQTGSFRDHYLRFAKVTGNAEMLEFLPFLEEACAGEEVWGLTSMHTIWLLAGDGSGSWLISIEHHGRGFQVSYLIPPADAPFDNAFVTGRRADARVAAELVRLALRLCGGWGGA
jgi:hypothetical protein